MSVKYKTGDKVRFLNETGGGFITRIDEKGMVFVETKDGFEIPASIKDLIPADGFSGDFLDQNGIVPNKVSEEQQGTKVPVVKPDITEYVALPQDVSEDAEFSLLAGFVPETGDPVFSSGIACYLINDSGFCTYYMLGTFEQGRYNHLSSGRMEANMKYYIRTFNQTDISKIAGLHLQAIWINEGKYFRKEPVDVLIDLTMVNFSKEHQYRENDYFDSKALLFTAWSSKKVVREVPGPEKDITLPSGELKPSEKKGALKKKKRNDETYEVDLHIDQMVADSSKYSPAEIVSMQIKRLHESMEEAISKKMRRVVIIHGVGQGTLKMQIRKELQEKYPEFLFQDASFKEYGFGATMVHLHTI
ncbi:MAG: DUF2027 domain-containing protein [Bacteroidales bacterium]|nr:DUF2027 domain-containing protein [Bacteroidales bacterium]